MAVVKGVDLGKQEKGREEEWRRGRVVAAWGPPM